MPVVPVFAAGLVVGLNGVIQKAEVPDRQPYEVEHVELLAPAGVPCMLPVKEPGDGWRCPTGSCSGAWLRTRPCFIRWAIASACFIDSDCSIYFMRQLLLERRPRVRWREHPGFCQEAARLWA